MVVRASIEVNAPPEEVFGALMDTGRYGEWNPFVTAVKGEIAKDHRVTLTVDLGGRIQKQRLVVREVVIPSLLVWTLAHEHGVFLRGGRTQRVIPTEGGCRYESEERLEGLLSPVVSLFFERGIRDGMEASCDALKAWVEGGNARR